MTGWGKSCEIRKKKNMKYELENEQLHVEFQSFGGALSSIKDQQGIEFLWQGDKNYWSGQAPVLFPICGSIRDDKAVTKDGKNLTMPRHGIVRKREFECVEQTKDQITFAIKSNEEMEEAFPYPFELQIQYTLCGSRVRVEYIVKNTGNETMPFQIGGHPGFNCPVFEGESYDDYWIEFEEEETISVPEPVTETGLINLDNRTPLLNGERRLRLTHEMFHKDAVILDQLKSKSLSLYSERHGKEIRMEFGDFPYLILWSSANDGPFIAIEPWSGLSTCNDESDIFEEKHGVHMVEPGEEKRYHFDVMILAGCANGKSVATDFRQDI